MMEQLFDDARRPIASLHLQFQNEIRRDLQKAGERTIAKIRPILEELQQPWK